MERLPGTEGQPGVWRGSRVLRASLVYEEVLMVYEEVLRASLVYEEVLRASLMYEEVLRVYEEVRWLLTSLQTAPGPSVMRWLSCAARRYVPTTFTDLYLA